MRGYILLVLITFLVLPAVFGQSWNWRTRTIPARADTQRIDSVSIVPGSFNVLFNDQSLDTSRFFIDADRSLFFYRGNPGDSLKITYKVFPIDFSKVYQRRKYQEPQPDVHGVYQPFMISGDKEKQDIFLTEGLNKNGSVSRGVTFGNSQDLTVNSNLDLQLSGKVSDQVSILAAISDNNIPIQPEGNTQQLQDFDQVYIQLFDENNKLTAGDFQLAKPPGHFMHFYKRAQGASFSTIQKIGADTSGRLHFNVSGAVSKGKFARNQIQGVEGNQGPYRLKGNENESFIIILSGTEQIYIDGELLVRGQDNDYVIDYNTAEVTFTPNRVITKDKRIIAEFQYTDKSYARSLLFTSGLYESNKGKVYAHIYSEQDSRNQPLQQDLSPEQKLFLSEIGDDIGNAFYSSIDTSFFRDDVILYALRDTMIAGDVFDSVLVFSINPDSALYKAVFSEVGQGRGNYVLVPGTANGKIFRWVAPLGGVPQGTHEPVILLVTPKKRQLTTVGGEVKVSGERLVAGGEMGYSVADQNTFSEIGSENDADVAFRGWLRLQPVQKENQKWISSGELFYEQVNDNFVPVERFRPVEFERDWNLLGKTINTNQRLAGVSASLARKGVGAINYTGNIFHADTAFLGYRNQLDAVIDSRRLRHESRSSIMNANGFGQQTDFIRWKSRTELKTNLINPGIAIEAENNAMQFSKEDSILGGSFMFHELEGFLSQRDSAVNQYYLGYRQRSDYAPAGGNLHRHSFAETWSATYGFRESSWSNLRTTLTYRELSITDSTLTTARPEQTFIGRIEYSFRALKSAIVSETFYETGSGLEQRKEFTYIEVAAGQGTHTWLGDLNENGIKDINEFEIARYSDQATYIRVFTPTLNFVKTYTNQFSQTLQLSPERVWGNKKGFKKVVGRFATQTAFRIERKTLHEEAGKRFNPFYTEVEDSSLLSTGSTLRHVTFFNRTSQVFGIEHIWQESKTKSLLVNGFESRTLASNMLRGRVNISRKVMVSAEGEQAFRTSSNQFSAGRNFNIYSESIEPKLTFQPGTFFRSALFVRYGEKQNKIEGSGEQLFSTQIGTEIRYSKVSQGLISAEVSYILHHYTGLPGTVVAYEMLEGLQPGENITWMLTWQRNLSKHMQLNLQYSGRVSETAPAVHTGGVQVRAFF